MWALALLALPLLLLADRWSVALTRIPIELHVSPTRVSVYADGQYLVTSVPIRPDAVAFVSASPTLREFQIDGTDNANNFTEDAADLAGLLPSPEFRFEAWMRDNATYGVWTDVSLGDTRTATVLTRVAEPSRSRPIAIPWRQDDVVDVSASLERPEAPASIEVMGRGQVIATLSVDRNARTLELAGIGAAPFAAYFPERPLPFAAEVGDSLLKVAIWAWVVLATGLSLTLGLSGATRLIRDRNWPQSAEVAFRRLRQTWPHAWRVTWSDRGAIVALAAALGASVAIALAQYHGQPHILDASAYFFQAKIFASGQLAAPAPTDLAAFQGPFMVAWQSRWFAQYPPATSAVLALGMLVGAPWLVEPLLGAAALFGIYLLGRRMFGRRTALLAVLLGALSPFFLFLSASYLSHTVALCFEVYFLVFALRFLERHRQRDAIVAGAFLGAMFCTRELSAVLCGALTVSWMVATHWKSLWTDRRAVVAAMLAGMATLGLGLGLYLAYNLAQTGSALVLPRQLFSPADRYGFGDGVGFYGRHTLAAGLVVLDQLLTSLMIDLFGWPFYLTLAFIPIALLRRDGHQRWDRFNMLLASALTVAQVGYFYHGIFLGPRYLFETLPFLLLLTSRGIVALPVIGTRGVDALRQSWSFWRGRSAGSETDQTATAHVYTPTRRAAVVAGALMVIALIGFNLAFYLPRQIAQHQDFTGLPSFERVDAAAIYSHHPHHALVITSNSMLFNYVLFPLNDPMLRGDTLYAFAPGPADVARLHREYPNRAMFELDVAPDGGVSFHRLIQ